MNRLFSRWLALLFALLTVASMSAEAMSTPQASHEADQPHALLAQDDHSVTVAVDLADLPLVHSFLDACEPQAGFADIAAPIVPTPSQVMTTEHAGVRLHRWLCVERC